METVNCFSPSEELNNSFDWFTFLEGSFPLDAVDLDKLIEDSDCLSLEDLILEKPFDKEIKEVLSLINVFITRYPPIRKFTPRLVKELNNTFNKLRKAALQLVNVYSKVLGSSFIPNGKRFIHIKIDALITNLNRSGLGMILLNKKNPAYFQEVFQMIKLICKFIEENVE